MGNVVNTSERGTGEYTRGDETDSREMAALRRLGAGTGGTLPRRFKRDRILPLEKLARKCLEWTRAAALINERSSLMAFVMRISSAWRALRDPLKYRDRLECARTKKYSLRQVAIADIVIWSMAMLMAMGTKDVY